MDAWKRRVFVSLTIGIGLCLGIAATEALLRATGRRPWTTASVDSKEPVMNELDPVLGWRNRPGLYVVPPYAPAGREIHVRILADGSRATSTQQTSLSNGEGARIVLVGGSSTLGWAISDEETLAWRLQAAYPSLRVANFGSAGYGTFQSLLTLERLFKGNDPPRMVLYGFIAHHEQRNVAAWYWLKVLAAFSRRNHPAVPYCTLDDNGSLLRHSLVRYPAWPFRASLATVNYLQDIWMYFTTNRQVAQSQRVTELLLLEMNDLCRANGATLAVVLFQAKRSNALRYSQWDDDFLQAESSNTLRYRQFLEEHDIPNAHCVYPFSPAMQVPGEGHPNGVANSLWTRCVIAALGAELKAYASRREPRAR